MNRANVFLSARHLTRLFQKALHVVIALVVAAPPAWATIDNLKAFKQAYPGRTAVSCKTCHQGIVGKRGDLNAYGLALQKLKGAGNATKDRDAVTT